MCIHGPDNKLHSSFLIWIEKQQQQLLRKKEVVSPQHLHIHKPLLNTHKKKEGKKINLNNKFSTCMVNWIIILCYFFYFKFFIFVSDQESRRLCNCILPSLPAPLGLPYQLTWAGDQSESDWSFDTLSARSLELKQEQKFVRRENRAKYFKKDLRKTKTMMFSQFFLQFSFGYLKPGGINRAKPYLSKSVSLFEWTV